MSESSPPARLAACPVCSELPAFASAALREGERLPDAASRLVALHPTPEGFWDTAKDYEITKKCPVCGQLYTYNYHYEFSVGYIEESVWLERHAPVEPPEPPRLRGTGQASGFVR